MVALIILSRWLHVISACLAIGGGVFIRFVQPRGLALLDLELQKAVFLKTRRAFKMIIHVCILLFLVTGTYNTMMAWDKYQMNPRMLHPLWGTHVLLGCIAIVVALVLLAGKQPPRSHRTIMATNLVILLLAVAAASTLKWAREKTITEHATMATAQP